MPAAVRDSAGRVLLVRPAGRAVWSLPMGGVEPGERGEEALQRQMWEETGLAVRVGRLVALDSDPVTQAHTRASGETVQYVTAYFPARPAGGVLRPDVREVLDARFSGPGQLPEPPVPPHRGWIAAVLG